MRSSVNATSLKPMAVLVLIVYLSFVFAGCGSDDDPASPPTGTQIGPEGGTVTAENGRVELVFPAGAVDEVIAVSVSPSSSPPDDAGMITARAYDFEPDGVQFEEPVTLTIHYTDEQVPSNVDEADLRLCKVVDGTWQMIAGSAVTVEENTVSGDVTSFSSYGPGRPSTEEQGHITVTPAEVTLPVYSTWTFAVTVEGLENEAVTWSITEGIIGGRVRGHGVYNAPGGGGVFHLRATSVAEPDLYGEAEVTVSTDWECPEEPPEPGYELVWARTIPAIFTRWIYGIAWHQGQLWVGGQAHLEHWSDQGVHLGWTGRGVDGPWPFEETYTGYHEGASESDVPAPWNDNGQFDDVLGVACDAVGNVYACDFGNSRVQKMSPGGTYLGQWDVDRPVTIGVSPDHHVYVEDHVPDGLSNLLRYSQQGVLVEAITTLEDGLGLDYFHLLGFDQEGEIFLWFTHDERVVARLDPAHEYLGLALREGDDICESEGAVTVDAEGNIFTADVLSGLFKKFDRDGWLLATWPLSGPGYESPRSIGGMTVDDYGNVYATDWTNGMILKFRQIDP